jgi:cell division septal protein FtsQ
MQPTSPLFNKNQEERRKKRAKLMWGALFLCIVLLVALVAVLRHPWIQIQGVIIEPTKTISDEAVRHTTEKFIEGSYMWVIPRTNTLFFSKRNLEKTLRTEFPSIALVTLTLDHEKKLHVTLQEKDMFGVWCSVEGNCFFIDREGVLFRESPHFSPGVYLTFRGTTLDHEPFLTEKVFSDELFQQLVELHHQLKDHMIETWDVTYDSASGDVTFLIQKLSNRITPHTHILMNVRHDAIATFESIDLLLQEKKFQEQFLRDAVSLETIDVRFPGKIFYKFSTLVTPPVLPIPPTKKP